ncbi:EF-hand calcium-binding domain-containing protein 4B-like isoform X1 [Centruroides vittatus]|uniref:EF-hand calcium-binding domain-containing protein 4B-like isoform X1 n=1 Tax=Centruroides vittatus TaxID=120091 RepID=UPI003510C4AD
MSEVLSSQNMKQVLVEKAHELFSLCDKEQKGIITKRDMQRLINELPLSPEQLEVVFDSLDSDKNGYLTLQEFTDGFGMFIGIDTRPTTKNKNNYDTDSETLEDIEEECEDETFEDFLEQLGAADLFEDKEHVRLIWMQLRSENIDMCRKFEDFLGKLIKEVKESKMECVNLETALKNRMNQHDEQVQQLYEEMEKQIKLEKERLLAEERSREKRVREELENEIHLKEKQLQELLEKQSEMEKQLKEITSAGSETKQENIKLQMERDNLERRLTESDRSMKEMQNYLEELRQKTLEDRKKRARAALQVSENIAMEREHLVKELDVLRTVNKQLLDEKDMNSTVSSRTNSFDEEVAPNIEIPSPSNRVFMKQGSVLSDYLGSQKSPRSSILSEIYDEEPETTDNSTLNTEEGVENEEILESTQEISNNNENTEMKNCRIVAEGDCVMPDSHENIFPTKSQSNKQVMWKVKCIIFPAAIQSSPVNEPKNEWKVKKSFETVNDGGNRYFVEKDQEMTIKKNINCCSNHQNVDNKQTRLILSPERVFKVVFVGDSGVGKSSFMSRFCGNNFRPNYTATIGVDFQVKSIIVEGQTIVLQLWDTAGQERFRSITKQYFRKADGVIIMYDITSESSFKSVRGWINRIKETADSPVLLLIGNKIDLCENDENRVILYKDGQKLAEEYEAVFYETSSKNGAHVDESVKKMASLLQVREDAELEKVLRLQEETKKNKCC